MTCRLRFFYLFLFSSLCFSEGLKSGQETWGGDSSALKYVKFGRLFEHEILNNQDCEIKSLVTSNKWSELVNKTKVESVENDQKDQQGVIFLNLYKWHNMQQDWKAEMVLKGYLDQVPLQVPPGEFKKIVKSCKKSDLWERNSNPKLNQQEVTNLKKEIQFLANQLGAKIKNKSIKSLPEKFSLEEYRKLVKSLKVTKSHDKASKTVSIQSQPVSILTEDKVRRDAQNTVRNDFYLLEINSASWSQLSRGQKMELLLHEMLGLMRLDDKFYQHSSRLLFDLDASDYAHP